MYMYIFICHNNQHIDCGHHRKDKITYYSLQDKKQIIYSVINDLIIINFVLLLFSNQSI